MVTDTKTNNLRIVLHQIYVSLYVEYVVKNPLSPIEHPEGIGVNCEMFELGVEQFVVRSSLVCQLALSQLIDPHLERVFDDLMGLTRSHIEVDLRQLLVAVKGRCRYIPGKRAKLILSW